MKLIRAPGFQGWVDITILTLGDGNLINLVSSSICWCQYIVLLKSALTHVRVWSPKQYSIDEGSQGKECAKYVGNVC